MLEWDCLDIQYLVIGLCLIHTGVAVNTGVVKDHCIGISLSLVTVVEDYLHIALLDSIKCVTRLTFNKQLQLSESKQQPRWMPKFHILLASIYLLVLTFKIRPVCAALTNIDVGQYL